jgi:hypothetical protein
MSLHDAVLPHHCSDSCSGMWGRICTSHCLRQLGIAPPNSGTHSDFPSAPEPNSRWRQKEPSGKPQRASHPSWKACRNNSARFQEMQPRPSQPRNVIHCSIVVHILHAGVVRERIGSRLRRHLPRLRHRCRHVSPSPRSPPTSLPRSPLSPSRLRSLPTSRRSQRWNSASNQGDSGCMVNAVGAGASAVLRGGHAREPQHLHVRMVEQPGCCHDSGHSGGEPAGVHGCGDGGECREPCAPATLPFTISISKAVLEPTAIDVVVAEPDV